MVQRHPTTWNLVQLEQAYRDLSQQPTVTADVRGQLDLRYSAIQHYKQVKAEYDDYFRLVSNTERKDAELAALQNSLDPQDAVQPIAPAARAQPGLPATGPSLNAPTHRRPQVPAMPVAPVVTRVPTPPQPAPSPPAYNPTSSRNQRDDFSKRPPPRSRRARIGESGAAPDGTAARGQSKTRNPFRTAGPVAACRNSERVC